MDYVLTLLMALHWINILTDLQTEEHLRTHRRKNLWIWGGQVHLGRSGRVHLGPSTGHYPAPRQCHRRSLPFTAPLADFPSLSKWYHFNGMFCSKKDPFDFLGFLRGWGRPKSQKGPFPRKTNLWKMTPLLRTGQNLLDVSDEWQQRLVILSKLGFRVRCSKKSLK